MMYVHNVVAFCVVRGDDGETWEEGSGSGCYSSAAGLHSALTKGNGEGYCLFCPSLLNQACFDLWFLSDG